MHERLPTDRYLLESEGCFGVYLSAEARISRQVLAVSQKHSFGKHGSAFFKRGSLFWVSGGFLPERRCQDQDDQELKENDVLLDAIEAGSRGSKTVWIDPILG